MVADIGQVTATAVTTLAPFMPFLIETSKVAGLKLADKIGEMGGEAAWDKAQMLWNKLKVQSSNDPELISAATIVAAKPNDEARQTLLAEVLGKYLMEDPDFMEEIFQLLGGQQAMQQVVAERESWIEEISQQISSSSGNQSVTARDRSGIRGVKQNIQRS
jgi:hypothetical protein